MESSVILKEFGKIINMTQAYNESCVIQIPLEASLHDIAYIAQM